MNIAIPTPDATPVEEPSVEASLSDLLQLTMQEHGFAIHAVLAEREGEPNVLYTMGLSQLTGYELLITMCNDAQLLGQLLQNAADRAAGKKPGPVVAVADGVAETRLGMLTIAGEQQPLRCVYRTVGEIERAFALMQYRVQGVETVYQLVLPDTANVLPGEASFDERFAQPL